MPTDAQTETARNIFKAANKIKPVAAPEPAQKPLPRDQSRTDQLLADLNARNIKTLEEAGAVPKHKPGDLLSGPRPGDTTTKTPDEPKQEQISGVQLPQLESGLPQEVHRVAAGTTLDALNQNRLGTKPKTGPRGST